MPLITLTTDFGTVDGFVGAMKGVILSIAPHAQIIDITHDIPACDVISAAMTLEAACPFFPKGTIHVAVVDPGVGSARAAIGIQTENALFVGPDNGIFGLAIEAEKRNHPHAVLLDGRTVRLSNPSFHRADVNATFHGRDIFSPVAAWLANGNLLEDMGTSAASRVTLDFPTPRKTREGLEIHVLRADRFGNLLTDLTPDVFQRWNPDARGISIDLGGIVIAGLSRTFSDVAVGTPVAYFGSGGRLEIALNKGSMEALLKSRALCAIIMKMV